MIDRKFWWYNHRFNRKMRKIWEYLQSCRRIENEIFCVTEEIELSIEILCRIPVPIEMIGMEIGEDSVM